MATTPEGKVKAQVSKILKATATYYFMPVQRGYGKAALDYIGISKGRGFVIETKRANKDPTERQELIIKDVLASGGRVFVIDGTPRTDTYRDLAEWLLS